LVLWGWILVLAGYYGMGVFLKDKPRMTELKFSATETERWGLLLMGAGFATEVIQSISAVPLTIAGTLNFFSSLRWLGLVLLVILATRGYTSLAGKIGIAVGTFLIGSVALGSGHAAQVARVGFTIALGIWIGKRRMDTKLLVGAAAVVLIVFSVRGVASQFRSQVWFGRQGGSVLDRTELMTELVTGRFQKKGLLGTIETSSETVFGRSATLDVFADVVQRTPERVPYWNGHTYYSLAGAFVPRFLWPDKPVKNVGQEFGHRYGYLHPSDRTTSFNMPVLVEFYANHGTIGVLLGSLVIGFVYRILMNLLNIRGQSDILSAAAVTLLLPLFNIESGVSITFGGLILDGMAIWGVLQIIKYTRASGG
jgi:hypothetical protein